MTNYVNGCRTVNCGLVKIVQGKEVEILSYEISRHMSNIVCDYFMENGKKVELTYHGNGHEIYFFKNRQEVHHYRSYNKKFDELPEKYWEKAQKLISIYKEVFPFCDKIRPTHCDDCQKLIDYDMKHEFDKNYCDCLPF